MDIFRAIITEAFNNEFRSYLSHRKAELRYRQKGTRGLSNFVGALQDSILYGAHVYLKDNSITFCLESGNITVAAHPAIKHHPRSTASIIDLADPAVDPVEAVREHVRRFLNR